MTNPPDPVAAPRSPVPEPVRPRSEVRGAEVFQGIGIGIGVSWIPRLLLLGIAALLVGDLNVEKVWPPLGLLVIFAPTAALVAALWWAIRARKKAWAIGMAIYAGVGALLLGPFIVGAGLAVVICGKW